MMAEFDLLKLTLLFTDSIELFFFYGISFILIQVYTSDENVKKARKYIVIIFIMLLSIDLYYTFYSL